MVKESLLSCIAALLVLLMGQVQAQVLAQGSVNNVGYPELWPVQQGRNWGYIDRAGRVVIPFKFDSAAQFSEGLATVGIKEKIGYIDNTGNFVIPPRFLSGYPFSSGMALVVTEEFIEDRLHMHKLGYINRSGNLTIKGKALDTKSLFITHKDLYFSDGLVQIEEKGKYGFMDRTGKIIILPNYDDAESFSEGLAAVKLQNRYGYIDKSGKMAIPVQFKDAGSFHEGLACVRLTGDQRCYIDTSGKPVIDGGNLEIGRPFSQGLAAVRDKNNKYGFIDRTGRIVIQPQFERVGDFSEGLAPVQPFNKRWPGNLAYINPKGEIVLQFKSTNPNSPTRVDWDLHAYRFFGGVALVSAGNEADEDAQVYLNQQGKIISPVVMRPQQVVQTPPAPPPMLAAKVHEPQSGSPPAPPETVPPTAPPVAPPSAPPDNDIEGHSVWPWTSTRLVAQEDVQSLSLAELMLMRNEIFARHGWVFTQDDLRQVFEAQPWYRPKGTLANRAEANRQAAAELSSVEKKNVQTILQYEKSLKSER